MSRGWNAGDGDRLDDLGTWSPSPVAILCEQECLARGEWVGQVRGVLVTGAALQTRTTLVPYLPRLDCANRQSILLMLLSWIQSRGSAVNTRRSARLYSDDVGDRNGSIDWYKRRLSDDD